MSVRHKSYRIRVLVEQVVETQTHPSTPVDRGTTDHVIVHKTIDRPLTADEFGEALVNPLRALDDHRRSQHHD